MASQSQLLPSMLLVSAGRQWMKHSTFITPNGTGGKRKISLQLLKSALQKGVRQGTVSAESAIQVGIEGLRNARDGARGRPEEEQAWSRVRANLHNRLLIIMCEEVFSALSSAARFQLLMRYRIATESRDLDPSLYVTLVRHLRAAAGTHCRFPSYMNALVLLVYVPPYASIAPNEIPGISDCLRQTLAALRDAARARGTDADLYGFRYDVKDNGLAQRYRQARLHDEKILRRHLRKPVPGTRKHDYSVFKGVQRGDLPAMVLAMSMVPDAVFETLQLPLEAHCLHKLAARVRELTVKKMHMAAMLMAKIVPSVAEQYSLPTVDPLPNDVRAPPLPTESQMMSTGVYDLHVDESPPSHKTYTYFSENSAVTPRTRPDIWAAAATVDGVTLTLRDMQELYKASKRLQDMYPPGQAPAPSTDVEVMGTRTVEDRWHEAKENNHVIDVDAEPSPAKRARACPPVQ